MSREQTAEALDLPPSKAKFHIDRLAEAGALDVEYRRVSGKQGPGAGHPAKLYRRAATEIHVSLPERRYDIMGHILASAIEQTQEGKNLDAAIKSSAHAEGVTAAATSAADAAASPQEAAPQPLEGAHSALSTLGYEASLENTTICLRNCPFDALAARHRDLASGANQRFVQGVLDGAGCTGVAAHLEPATDRCCVVARAQSNLNKPS